MCFVVARPLSAWWAPFHIPPDDKRREHTDPCLTTLPCLTVWVRRSVFTWLP